MSLSSRSLQGAEPDLRIPTSAAEIAAWARQLEAAEPEEVLAWAHEHFGRALAIVTSFQAAGMVILDLAHRSELPLRVITLDTGRLPEETYLQMDRVRSRYGVELEIVAPDTTSVEALVRDHGPNLFLESRELRLRCCHVRKVAPFRRAVSGLDAWISGIRREDGGPRSAAAKVELDSTNRPAGGLVKVNPLADWSESRIWAYLREHNVPYHPLYDRGYRSIGCAPCTRPARPGEDARSERWWWESGSKECGLHLVQLRPNERAAS